jgi:hypothetical protein
MLFVHDRSPLEVLRIALNPFHLIPREEGARKLTPMQLFLAAGREALGRRPAVLFFRATMRRVSEKRGNRGT